MDEHAVVQQAAYAEPAFSPQERPVFASGRPQEKIPVMAVARPVPTCRHCGRPVAKGVYENQEGVPSIMRKIGDTFIRWEFYECDCDGAKKERANRADFDISKAMKGE